ncbi:MAG: dockerin type I domain-containing protein [Oscillospiraceae bacterium]|nr:dockerin type I domain-containing protein [Oscillospiraceae bacterium]
MKKNLILLSCLSLASFMVLSTMKGLKSNSLELEKVEYPSKTLAVTQVSFEDYSHSNSYDIDCSGRYGTEVTAPFTGYVTYAVDNYGFVMFSSKDEVQFADGSVDYATITIMHTADIDHVKQLCSQHTKIRQGEPLLTMGGRGTNGNPSEYDVHLHMGIHKGKLTGPNGGYQSISNMMPYDAFYLPKGCRIVNPGKTRHELVTDKHPELVSVPGDWTGLWRYADDTAPAVTVTRPTTATTTTTTSTTTAATTTTSTTATSTTTTSTTTTSTTTTSTATTTTTTTTTAAATTVVPVTRYTLPQNMYYGKVTTAAASAKPVTRTTAPVTTAKPVTTTAKPVITTAAATAKPTPVTTTAAIPQGHPYDINGDGIVSQADYSMINKYVLGQLNGKPVDVPTDFFAKADTNHDGSITEEDARVIRKYLNS